MWFHLAFNYLLWVGVFISSRLRKKKKKKENHLGKINAAEQVWGKEHCFLVHPTVPPQKRCLVWKFQQINNKSVSSFPLIICLSYSGGEGVIFHLQQVVVYIVDKLHPYNPWHACLCLLQQLLLAHGSRHPPLLMEMTHTRMGWNRNTMLSCRHLHSCTGFKS